MNPANFLHKEMPYFFQWRACQEINTVQGEAECWTPLIASAVLATAV